MGWVREGFQLSERRACRALGVERSLLQYRSVRPTQEPLRARIRETASVRVSYGYRRVHVLLRREGWSVNWKRVYRLCREDGLCLKRRRSKRRRAAAPHQARVAAKAVNERWAMDFMSDALASGQGLRVLTVLDTYTRECVALEAGVHFRGGAVAQMLTRVGWSAGFLQ